MTIAVDPKNLTGSQKIGIADPILIAASVRPRIGSLATIPRYFPEGLTVAGIIEAFGTDIPSGFAQTGVVILGDIEILEPKDWHRIKPKAGTSLSFHCALGKGGDALMMAATAAIVAAQVFAYFIPGVGPLVSAAIGIAGGFALNYLAAQQAQGGGKKRSPKQLGDGGFTANTLKPYEQFATVLGIRRVPAPFIAPPYLVIDQENTIGYGIIGLAGYHELSDPYINGSPAEVLEERFSNGDESQQPSSVYGTRTVLQYNVNQEFPRFNTTSDATSDERWTLAHSPTNADVDLYDCPKWLSFRLGKKAIPRQITFDITFPQGLARIDTSAKACTAFQYKFTHPNYSDIYGPILVCRANTENPIRAKIIHTMSPDNTIVGNTSTSSSQFWAYEYANSASQVTWGNSADAREWGSATGSTDVTTDDDSFIVYVEGDWASLPELADPGWTVHIRQGCTIQDNRLDATNNEYNYNGGGVDVDLPWFNRHSVGAVDRVVENQTNQRGQAQLNLVTVEYPDDPLEIDGISFYEFSTYNKDVQDVTVIAERKVEKKWNRATSTWTNEPHVSQNPAELFYDILASSLKTLNQRPMSSTIIDTSATDTWRGLGSWANYCEDNYLTCNAFITSGSVEDALQQCCVAGSAYLTRSQKWGVYIERSRVAETPVQVFSPRNYKNFRIERSYEQKAHALIVTFDNEDDDYQTDPGFIVYAPGYAEVASGSNVAATIFETVDFRSVTKDWQAKFLADRQLKIAKYRQKQYVFETDARYLAAPRGSLIGINNYVLASAHGFAAIREVRRQVVGGVTVITGLLLDTDLDMQSGTTGFAITTNSGTVVTAQATQPGARRDIKFSTPLTNDTTIEEGCTIVCGVVSSEYIRAIVDDVQPGPDCTATIIAVDEAPSIFS